MERIAKFLQQRQEQGLLRQLNQIDSRSKGMIQINDQQYYDLCSNDYLGLADDQRIIAAAISGIKNFGVGAGASRLLSGNFKPYQQLEQETAKFKSKPACLVFNSGYQANVGLIPALIGQDDAVFCDKLAHASLIDGIQLSQADCYRFKHNDITHLRQLLEKNRKQYRNACIITESVFSMDGDCAELVELVNLKKEFDCWLFVDEAHATGIFSKSGAGLVDELGLSDSADFIMGTYSKALGGFGAYLACSQQVKDFLINSCRSFIYSTALPMGIIEANRMSIEIVQQESGRRIKLLQTADFFRAQLIKAGFKVLGTTQIVPLVIGDSQKALECAKSLQKRNWWVLPIRWPTVPKQQARLRFSLTWHQDIKCLQRLVNDIIECVKI